MPCLWNQMSPCNCDRLGVWPGNGSDMQRVLQKICRDTLAQDIFYPLFAKLNNALVLYEGCP